MQNFIKQNALSLVLFLLFAVFLVGQGVVGYIYENQELAYYNQPPTSFIEYLGSGNFIEAVFENWESEFLQMGALVVLTIWLRQKGAADSKKLRDKEAVDTSSRYSIISASSWRNRKKAIASMLYGNSLSIALFALFLISFVLHASSGVQAVNQEAQLRGQEQINLGQYMTSARFWFESFQNWQSEFLSVAVLLVLSIFLRQRRSPESKPVNVPNSETGRS